MNKKVAVIGAGIAGLSAGCYLQKFGFETEIFEAHSKAGVNWFVECLDPWRGTLESFKEIISSKPE